jgi:Ala-tRNA(Pro) deacylase
MDKDLWKEDIFQFHPLVNTSTLVISKTALSRFVKMTGHPVAIVDVPARR